MRENCLSPVMNFMRSKDLIGYDFLLVEPDWSDWGDVSDMTFEYF